MTSSKLNPPAMKSNYNSVNVSQNAEGGMVGGLLNVSNEGGVGSGASTPNHLSQQNLIKIMKKIKSSNP
jgi:4-hydroxy-3-methylbut-2-enyl diphosphate reductase IspH